MSHLVIMAAGTGGHIDPGAGGGARDAAPRLERQLARHRRTAWRTSSCRPSGIALDRIGFSGLRGKGLLHTLTGGLRLLKAFWDCLAILRRRGADAVLGMGGYVCFPGGLMASLLSKPLVLVNADAALLLSNKALLPVADRVAFGFDGEAARRTKQGVVTGNPVRAEIEALPAPAERFAGRSGPLQLLVVGGSLGAKVLNDTLPAALAQMPPASARGSRTRPAARSSTRCAPPTARPASRPRCCPSSTTWRARLAACDLMVCRAGAITVSELCAAGVPSDPGAADRQHHLAPARQRRVHGAARRRAAPAAGRADAASAWPQLLRGLTIVRALLPMAEKARAWRGRMPLRAWPTRSRRLAS